MLKSLNFFCQPPNFKRSQQPFFNSFVATRYKWNVPLLGLISLLGFFSVSLVGGLWKRPLFRLWMSLFFSTMRPLIEPCETLFLCVKGVCPGFFSSKNCRKWSLMVTPLFWGSTHQIYEHMLIQIKSLC